MSHPCLSVPSTFRRDDSQNEEPSTANKRARIAFDDIESMDASAYLAGVVKEAKQMPDIFVAAADGEESESNEKSTEQTDDAVSIHQGESPRPKLQINESIDGSAASLSYLLSKRSSIIPPPSIQHLPKDENVQEWTESVVSNFVRLRKYLERSKAKGFGGKQTARKPLPTMKDRSSWHIFCVGLDEASGNSGSYFADDYGETNDNHASKPPEDKATDNAVNTVEELPPWRINLPADGYEPSVCLLLQMDQVMIRRVLSHLAYYIDLGWSVTSGSSRRGEWIYALLARLEKPVHRDDAAVLFGLLKNLTLARSKIDFSKGEKGRNNLAKLNVLIVLVGVYFEQGGSLKKIMECE